LIKQKATGSTEPLSVGSDRQKLSSIARIPPVAIGMDKG